MIERNLKTRRFAALMRFLSIKIFHDWMRLESHMKRRMAWCSTERLPIGRARCLKRGYPN